jgi:hypothetical protein
MKTYDTSIPGWMYEKELMILSTLAGLVPENGRILEVGCFLGSSTTALYRGKHPSVQLDVVDTFKVGDDNGQTMLEKLQFSDLKFTLGNPDIFDNARMIAKESGWQQAFKFCIVEEMYNDINTFPMSSKDFIKDKRYNLTFIDASHTLDDVIHDIKKYISDDDLLLGDDYHPWYQGVPVALNVTRNNRTLIVFQDTKLWALVPKFGYWKELFVNNNLLFL